MANTGYALSRAALIQATELALLDFGLAVGGSDTTVQDTKKHWTVNVWTGGEIKIIKTTGAEYTRVIASNTANTITFAALPAGVVVGAGDIYAIRTSGASMDISDRWNRLLGKIDLQRVLGADLAHGNPLIVRLSTGEAFEVDLPTLARLHRWGRNITPAWAYSVAMVAPAALTDLVAQVVGAGLDGYIYGFFISAQEANRFLVSWTSGGILYTKHLIFGAGGSVEVVDQVAFNEGQPADAGTNITITNVNAGGALMVYQAGLLYAEV